ncbi:GH15 family glucan-1,4-alpha-glucosidase [Granulicella aggregans]|uniref:Trehalase n=1 Tax=Granulicella aggregans TaxID=474949 RepID=A0A7W7ZB42_9BACT|nr:glycoside hydrolase family 15 protein [Granulicella aggregans]MBB5056625.1 GH15 family glucan-1,4-alpha-glucosidase [Granulicella aggregans]
MSKARRTPQSSPSKAKLPLHGSRIEDYAIIGDCETAALVSLSGSIDWLCLPTFSSAACFAALLGTADHGHWKIAPSATVLSTHRTYAGPTMVLETTFETRSGAVKLIDFMPARGEDSNIIRIVRGLRGKVKMETSLALRFDYGRTVPWVTRKDHELRAVAGPDMVVVRGHHEGDGEIHMRGKGLSTVSEFTIREGETVSFTLTYRSSLLNVPSPLNVEKSLASTLRYWKKWMSGCTYKGEYGVAVKRSLMTLKAMTYRPSGGIVAAVTTSLPESIGGVRNWDYRYCWLRDTSFTLLVLMLAGYRDEAVEWRKWLLRAVAGDPAQVQTIYGICGERELKEWQAGWLPGYENSKPVNIGNGAVGQFQLDVFGEVAAALARTPQADDDLRVSSSALQAALVNHLCDVWQKPDEGIWEVRGPRRHFVHSKVMAWVAVDRAIRTVDRYGHAADLPRWKKVRAEIHAEVMKKGFNKKLNSFVQYYGSTQLDASCLRIGMVGFLPQDDPRIIGTVNAIHEGLTEDGFVLRYKTEKSVDGLPGTEGSFLACSYWMVTSLYLIGRKDQARRLFERLLKLNNDVGLLAEEYDPRAKRMVGNFPQALSHIAQIHAAFTLSNQWTPAMINSPIERA